MKNRILVILSIVFLLSSCIGGAGDIKLSRSGLNFGAEGGKDMISTKGIWGFAGGGEFKDGEINNYTARITDNKDDPFMYLEDKWVHASIERNTGDMIITVQPNEQPKSREYDIDVWCADTYASIKIFQKGRE